MPAAATGRQSISQNGKISRSAALGEVLELADRHDLGLTKAKVNIKQLLNEFLAITKARALSSHDSLLQAMSYPIAAVV